MKVAFYTLGCKVNQYETNAMTQMFLENGYEIETFDNVSDIYVINTCSVTNVADKKSRQIIHRARELNENAIIIVTGCYAQANAEQLEAMQSIDIVIGNNDKKNIVEITEKYLQNKTKIIDVKDIGEEKKFSDFGTTTYTEKTRAVIKVQDGCNNFCTYCIIPYTKGRVRSRAINSILDEITKIVALGIKEVVITGIHIASYGRDFVEKTELIDLLEKINEIDGLERIRLGSLEPNLITEQFVTRLKKLNKICNHFHLSLQSGCNDTLKRMNRKYDTTKFLEATKLLRRNFKDVALTTDIIVGFPGETDAEFQSTYDFLQNIKFSKMHVFKYSQRKGTVAAKMPNQISNKEKEQRSKKLIELSDKNEKKFLDNFINRRVKVLFEVQENGVSKGHTTNYITVNVNSFDLENKIEEIYVNERTGLMLYGTM